MRLALENPSQDDKASQEHDQRYPKVDVLEDRRPPALRLFRCGAIWHDSLCGETFLRLKTVYMNQGCVILSFAIRVNKQLDELYLWCQLPSKTKSKVPGYE